TITVADICLGYRPRFGRAYRRAFAYPGRLFGAFFMMAAVVILGMIALIVPGIILANWYLFTQQVVVLEGRGGWPALQRSRELGRGFYFRNFGVYFTVTMAFYLVLFLFEVILLALFVGLFSMSLEEGNMWIAGINVIMSALTSPLLPVAAVLLYY